MRDTATVLPGVDGVALGVKATGWLRSLSVGHFGSAPSQELISCCIEPATDVAFAPAGHWPSKERRMALCGSSFLELEVAPFPVDDMAGLFVWFVLSCSATILRLVTLLLALNLDTVE